MLRYFKEKIVAFVGFNKHFFVRHLPHIVFLVFSFQFLVVAGALPYFNLISQYSYYVFTTVWVIAVFLFRKQITSKFILKMIMILIFLGIPVALLSFAGTADALGYAVFVLISTGVVKKSMEDWSIIKTIKKNSVLD
ncbi:MAG: hypothetical protein HY427_00070 [Candidatus Levybacteria bacterium]|nr:hypothetical protein [Candidatus Levybacteria bacterium]